MKYRRPHPFREALAAFDARALLPTSLGTAELDALDADLRRRAEFSAKVEDVRHLDTISTVNRQVLAGEIDVATARLRVKQYLWQTGYQAPPEKQGGLEDFASTRRTDLQIGTNVDMMRGLGAHIQGQDEAILDAYPAQELVRVIDSRVKRDWGQIWRDKGGPVTSAWPRMIARKDDPIWVAISRFGNPYAPFDFGSGMDLQDISRREAMRLGLIDLNRRIEPDREAVRDFGGAAQATLAIEDERLRAALEATGVGRFDADGVFRAGSEEQGAGSPLANRGGWDPNQPRDRSNGRWANAGGPPTKGASDSLGRRPAPGENSIPDVDNIARGRAAIERVMARKGGSVQDAMFVEDLGEIEFAYGTMGDRDSKPVTHSDGGGLLHTADKHGRADLMRIPEVIVKGERLPAEKGERLVWNGKEKAPQTVWKRRIKHEGMLVTLSSRSENSTRQWLVTGFTEDKK